MGGGLIEFVKKGIISKRLKGLGINISDTFYTDIVDYRLFCVGAYIKHWYILWPVSNFFLSKAVKN